MIINLEIIIQLYELIYHKSFIPNVVSFVYLILTYLSSYIILFNFFRVIRNLI